MRVPYPYHVRQPPSSDCTTSSLLRSEPDHSLIWKRKSFKLKENKLTDADLDNFFCPFWWPKVEGPTVEHVLSCMSSTSVSSESFLWLLMSFLLIPSVFPQVSSFYWSALPTSNPSKTMMVHFSRELIRFLRVPGVNVIFASGKK